MRAAIIKSRSAAAVAALLCAVMYGVGGGISAQQAPAPSGITVSPASVALTLQEGSSQAAAPISIRNNYTEQIELSVALQGLVISGQNKLVPSGALNDTLAASMSLTPTSLVLRPGQSINVMVTISDSDRLPPGGQYASVLIKQIGVPGTARLSLNTAVSVVVFIVKEAGAQRMVRVDGLRTDGAILQTPASVTANFHNTGNVIITPRATVAVTDPFGHVVANGVTNIDSSSVLPGSNVRLRTALTSRAVAWIPGFYGITMKHRYDGTERYVTVTQRKFVVPYMFLLLVSAIAIIIVAIWYLVRGRIDAWLYRRRKKSLELREPLPGRVMDVVAPKKRRKPVDKTAQ